MTAAPGVLPAADRFELLRLLGRGSFSSVHAARDRSSGDLVALKVLTLGLGLHGSALATAQDRFATEASTARRLKHPDIVAVLDVGTLEQTAWLAMELVPGGHLGRYTTPLRLLPEPLALRVAERLAGALGHAHALGVLHRDIKPTNVLVHWPGDIVKLADFGLARTEDGMATSTGVMLGSPAYMAPEQLAGAVPDAQTDFYALGVTLFQLLSGHLPHQGATMGALLQQVATGTAINLRALRPELPTELAALVARLLSRTAAERAFSGTALAEELRTIRQRLPGVQPDPAGGAMSR